MSRMLPGVILALILTIFLANFPAPASAWQYTRDGAPASALVVDPSGDVISAGFQDEEGELAVVVVNHSGANGSERWRRIINRGGPTYNAATSLVRDAFGAIVVASYQRERYSEYTGFVAKLAQNGDELWRIGPTGDGFFAIETDDAGDVIAVGAISGPEPNDDDIVVVKLSGATGTELWRFVLNGTLNESDEARALAVDASGDVLVGGSLTDNPGLRYPDFLVLKLSGASGTEIWRRKIESLSSHGGQVASIAVDDNGDVLAGGHAVLIGWCDFVVAKFGGADGTELWRSVVDGPGCDQVNSIALDSLGDVFAAGSLGPVLFTTMKFSGTSGSLTWRHDIPNDVICTGGHCAGAHSVQVDPDGNAVVTGNLSGADVTVVKLDAADGADMWFRKIDIDGCADSGRVVAIDSAGDAVIGGFGFARIDGTCQWPFGSLYVVLKLTGLTGKDYWAECHDDRDNDADGVVDFPGDADCDAREDALEAPDTDGDGAPDDADNCLAIANPNQRDSDSDGYGNFCDGDFNNDGFVTPRDTGEYVAAIASFNPPGDGRADMNGDGFATPIDNLFFIDQLVRFRPGPSGYACAGTIPCP